MSIDGTAENRERKTAARKSKGWIWYFVTLAVLAVPALLILIWFNSSQQLTREQLAAARALWERSGPKDYDLEYTKEGSVTGKYEVQVRKGRVVSAKLDGRALEPRLYPTCDMTALFDDIEQFLELDGRPGSRRTFKVAQFDPADGRLLRFVRSVTATQQRIEIRVKLTPPATEGVPLGAEAGRN